MAGELGRSKVKTRRKKRQEVKYKGRIARRSAWIGAKRWYAVCHTPNGVPFDPWRCPQFATLAAFREWVRVYG